MNLAVVQELRLTGSSETSRKNLVDVTSTVSLDGASGISNDVFALAANNGDHDLAAAEKTYTDLTTFLFVLCSAPVEVSLVTSESGSEVAVTMTVKRMLLLNAAFLSVTVRNPDENHSVELKVIAA